jgi:hypothetical protein
MLPFAKKNYSIGRPLQMLSLCASAATRSRMLPLPLTEDLGRSFREYRSAVHERRVHDSSPADFWWRRGGIENPEPGEPGKKT